MSSTRLLVASMAFMALSSLLSMGCSHHVYSPPGRAFPLETVAPVGEGRIGVQLEGGYHDITWGAEALAGTARLRYGVHEEIDLLGETTVVRIKGDSAADTSPNIYAGRVGAKGRLTSFLALQGGMGAGTSAGGQYVSPDLGLIVAYENQYVVPYLALRGFASQPVGAKEVDTTAADRPVDTHMSKPKFTRGVASSAGVRMPLPWGVPDPTWALMAGGGMTLLEDNEDTDAVRNLGAGVEVMF